MKKILITGALGQVGTDLTVKLGQIYNNSNVIASDIIQNKDSIICQNFSFEILDVLSNKQLASIVDKYKITYIIHLASMLSAKGENNPQGLWNLNMGGLYNILEIAREKKLGVFVPSSIAAFGGNSDMNNIPQTTIQRPTTIYGISKVSGELLCDYYFTKFGVDTRGLRFPGLISYKALPGGGTTDYAIDIFYKALADKQYVCPLKKDTYLDMMYIDDAIDAVVKLMEADPKKLQHRNAFNISSMSIAPQDFALEIKNHIPDFKITYEINNVLQSIADSWPRSMEVTCAEKEWKFAPKINLAKMSKIMLENIKVHLN